MEREEIKYVSDSMTRLLEPLRGMGKDDAKVKQNTESFIRNYVSNALKDGYFRIGRSEREGLFAFTGTRYMFMKEDEFVSAVKRSFEILDVGLVYTMNIVRKIYKDVTTSVSIPSYTPTKGIISFRNKILDMSDYSMHEVSGEYASGLYLDFDYDPKAKCPRWEKFLHEVLSEEASILVLQEYMGAIFIDRNQLEIEGALFLYGKGANGKSVIFSVLETILGDNMSTTSLHELCTGQNTSYFLADIDGKLLNYSSDENNSTFSSGIFKQLASGEKFTVRRPCENPYPAENWPLLMTNLNKIPPINDSSEGLHRRLMIIPFLNTIPEEKRDKNLKYKLRDEVSGIFNWIMEGRKRIVSNKGHFTESALLNRTRAETRINSNSVLSFLYENGWSPSGDEEKGDVQIKMSMSTLYNGDSDQIGYRKYCEENGFSAKSTRSVREDMESEGYKYSKSMRISSSLVTSGFILWKVKSVAEDADIEDNIIEDTEDFPF